MSEILVCSHGDPTCPCPDSDPCHYEGRAAMPCPTLASCHQDTDGDGDCSACHLKGGCPDRRKPHCHVEGCRWDATDQAEGGYGYCGLAKLGLSYTLSDPLVTLGPLWACGATRWMKHMTHGEINNWMLRGVRPERGADPCLGVGAHSDPIRYGPLAPTSVAETDPVIPKPDVANRATSEAERPASA